MFCSCFKVPVLLSLCLFAAVFLAAAEAPRKFRQDPQMPAYTLPDALTTTAGVSVASAEQWKSVRRPEILELFRSNVYGRVPATPYEKSFHVVNEDRKALNGDATLREVDVKIAASGTSLVIRLNLFIPNKTKKPAPAFLLICNRGFDNIDPTREKKAEFWPVEEGIARGYAMAVFYNGDVDPDKYDEFKDGIHGILDHGERKPDSWGTIAAWAWGASRCLDYLESDKDIAKGKVGVIGHSRGGKTALWAGAQDERFAIVISNDSGCGGASPSRRKFEGRESVARINASFPHWFCGNFKRYGDHEDNLPVDQHMLIALMAPRAVAVGSAAEDYWADPRGEFMSAVEAGKVYRLFGMAGLGAAPEMPAIGESLNGDGVHYHIRDGKHNLTLHDWNAYMDFSDHVFKAAK